MGISIILSDIPQKSESMAYDYQYLTMFFNIINLKLLLIKTEYLVIFLNYIKGSIYPNFIALL